MINKYIVATCAVGEGGGMEIKKMEQNEQLQQERREARRKRRVRNQILAYMTMICLIIGVAAGIVFGVKYLTESAKTEGEIKQDQVGTVLEKEDEIIQPDVTPTEPPVVELTPAQKLDEIVNAGIEVMPLEDKVAGLFLVTPESITGVDVATKAGDGTKEALAKYSVGGIIYNAKNMKNETQFKEMISNTMLYAHYPLFIAVEEEGGTISPLAQSGLVAKTDSAKTVAATGDANQAYQSGGAIGAYLADYGFNLNLAPVADLTSVDKSVIGDRSYGSDAATVSGFVTSAIQGLEEQGIDTCLKHFPGLGSTAQNPDKGLSSSERSEEEFRENEFKVFQAGIDAGADMIMVSNMAAPSLGGDNIPCSMSPAIVTGILRREMGFDGVIITDSMSMKAISDYYGADQAAVLALRAGCDMILMPENFEKAYNGVLEAVRSGEIDEERINDALRRVYRIKYADRVEE